MQTSTSLAVNTVKYKIYSSALKELDDFRNVKKEILEFIQPWISDYLWQVDEFVLKISKKKYFFGTCKFGDNVEDEWFITWLLFQISQQFRDLCITVEDEDGQFLLITAAPALPEWVVPEVVKNRVFLKGGRLHIIPPTYSCSNLESGLKWLNNPTIQSQCSKSVHKLVFKRMKGWPETLLENPGPNHHYCTIAASASVGHILRCYPFLINKIIHTFYHRDMISLNAARKMKKFEVTEDNTVFTRVRFTRCLYAQIASQKFDCPTPFRLAGYKRSEKDPQKLNYDLGVKISCGLEMLYQLGKQRRNKSESDEKISNSIDEILSEPHGVSDFTGDLPPDDDTEWMTITEEDLEKMMKPLENMGKNLDSKDLFGDNPEFDLGDFVGSMKNFMGQISDMEGIDQYDPDFQAMCEEDMPAGWEQLMGQMDYELNETKVGVIDDRESNIATNLITSFEAQNGRSGPVSNLSNFIGQPLPFSAKELNEVD